MKKIYYEQVKIRIDTSGFAKLILNLVIWQYRLPDSIISDRSLVFISNFDHHYVIFCRSKKGSGLFPLPDE